MKAVKGKDNILSLINKFETQLYDQAELFGSLKLNELSERDAHLADIMHQKNIFNKVNKNGCECYTIYSAKQKL